jgi:hypothetical protein
MIVMSTTELSPDCQSIARLFELSRNGEIENSEFQQLGRQIYDKLFETYCQAPLDAQAE